MKKRIFRSMCCVTLLCVVLACICITGVLYKFSFDNLQAMIRDEALYLAAALNSGDLAGLAAARAAFTRVTLVDSEGTVVFDSQEDPAHMENHADRPEIAGAFRTGAAEARRYSETLAAQTFYRAVRLQNGQVVRISGDMDSVWGTALKYLPYILLAFSAAILLSGISAHYLSGRIATPINNVNLDNPLSNEVYEELSPLLRRMERQRLEIREQLAQMEEQRRGFDAITGSMREGLILLGKDAEVLSINPSALRALNLTREECVGRHILHMNRNEAFQKVVARGLGGAAGEAVLRCGGREYQLLASPVDGDDAVGGTVLLLLDVTDKLEAERMRREFTANVSHELQTPLTSISGFAEIIENGMATPEDVPQFARRIYSEAKRMIALVDDILQLSRLDEKSGEAPRERVDLLALARDVAQRLLPSAEAKGVRMEVSGDAATVCGVPHVLDEMVYNLCDNAIKYNKRGGSVRITVDERPDNVALAVADTGIGIPVEHRARVFERFYRVDQSHSRQTGGTGLGLSIVKHGALFHNAGLELESEEGVGTTIRIHFPKEQAPSPPERRP